MVEIRASKCRCGKCGKENLAALSRSIMSFERSDMESAPEFRSYDDDLLDNFFDRSSYLYEEPGNLLKQAPREPAIYNAIIKAISSH